MCVCMCVGMCVCVCVCMSVCVCVHMRPRWAKHFCNNYECMHVKIHVHESTLVC